MKCLPAIFSKKLFDKEQSQRKRRLSYRIDS